MYAAAGGASLAGRKARHGRAAPQAPAVSDHADHPVTVRAYSCTHWEARLRNPPVPPPPPAVAPAVHVSPAAPVAPADHEHDQTTCECAQGRAAWQEAAALASGGAGAGAAGAGGAARRCSVPGDHPRARSDHRKWHRTNRVRDASYGSSSDSEGESELESGTDAWGVARLLYAGLGTLAVGLVVYFVGTGDKGFKTPALRLVGPTLIVAGLACCLLRIMFCICAKPCCTRVRRDHKENRRLSRDGCGEEVPLADRAALLAGAGPRVGPAQCSPARRRPDTSSCDVSSISSAEEDERLRRYRTARPPPDPHPRRPREPVHPAPPQPHPPQPPPPQPPPAAVRGVSFARGELVLSPSQLRS